MRGCRDGPTALAPRLVATGATAPPAAGLVGTASGARGDPATTSGARGVVAELSGREEAELQLRVWARCNSLRGPRRGRDSSDGVPRGQFCDDGDRSARGGQDDLPGPRRRGNMASLGQGQRVLLSGVWARFYDARGQRRGREESVGVTHGRCRRDGGPGGREARDKARRRRLQAGGIV